MKPSTKWLIVMAIGYAMIAAGIIGLATGCDKPQGFSQEQRDHAIALNAQWQMRQQDDAPYVREYDSDQMERDLAIERDRLYPPMDTVGLP